MDFKYNIITVPFIICFIFFCYIFLSIINSGYFFEIPVIITSSFVLFIWLTAFIISEIKNPTILKSKKNTFIIIIAGILIAFWFVKNSLFHGYLNLEPISALLNDRVNPDTLYHTNFAKDLSNFGIKGYFLNEIRHYHVLSHVFVSFLSKIIRVPCFFTYNYLFHIIFLPIYIFMLQKVMLSFRCFIGINDDFSIYDFIFFIVFLLGFNFFNIADNASCWYNSIIVSESCLFSMIIMLFAFELFFYFHKSEKKLPIIIKELIVCVFIIVISGAKISTGVIFYILCCFVLFRLSPKSKSTWLRIILYTTMMLVSYLLFSRAGELSRSVSKSSVYANSNIMMCFFKNFLAFPRKYISKDFCLVHYLFYSLPFIIMCKKTVKDNLFSKDYFLNKNNIYFEITFVLTVVSFLPGLFMDIVGGSALYFVLPVYIISVIMLWAFNFHSNFCFNNKKWNKVIFILIFASVLYPSFLHGNIYETLVSVLKAGDGFTNLSKIEMVKKSFQPSEQKDDNNYKLLEKTFEITKNNSKDWCIIVKDGSDLTKKIISYGIDVLLIQEDDYIKRAKDMHKKKMIVIKDNTLNQMDLVNME